MRSIEVIMIAYGYAEYQRRFPASAAAFLEAVRSMQRIKLAGGTVSDEGTQLMRVFSTSIQACSVFNPDKQDAADFVLEACSMLYETFPKGSLAEFFETVPDSINKE